MSCDISDVDWVVFVWSSPLTKFDLFVLNKPRFRLFIFLASCFKCFLGDALNDREIGFY